MNIIVQERKIEKVIERITLRVLRGVLNDPDFRLELRADFEKKLKSSAASKKRGRLKDFERVVAAL